VSILDLNYRKEKEEDKIFKPSFAEVRSKEKGTPFMELYKRLPHFLFCGMLAMTKNQFPLFLASAKIILKIS